MAQLLPPIDLTGEPTVWAFQELQSSDRGRKWVRENIRPAAYPSGVWRTKLSDLEVWDPYRAWPDHMLRGGYRARLLTWGNGRWNVHKIVQRWL